MNIMGRNPADLLVVAFGGGSSSSSSSSVKTSVSMLSNISWTTTGGTKFIKYNKATVPCSLSLGYGSCLQFSFSSSDEYSNHDDDAAASANDDDDDDNVPLNDESLVLRFQRALVLQRAGEYDKALHEYQTFVKAAESCNVSAEMYAEVHVNMGAIYMKLKNWPEARHHFKRAIAHRDVLGNAHVNLALCLLAERQAMSLFQSSSSSGASSTSSTTTADRNRDDVSALKEARYHCKRALDIYNDQDDDKYDDQMHAHAKNAATRLLRDIQDILRQLQMGQEDNIS
jgi:tetratricopeptide (TPR) repeat protein